MYSVGHGSGYIRHSAPMAFIFASVLALSSLRSSTSILFRQIQAEVMDATSSQPRPVSSHPHWTIPVPREETLAVREKFGRLVGVRRSTNLTQLNSSRGLKVNGIGTRFMAISFNDVAVCVYR